LTRKEIDSLGEVELPDSAYYGVQTARAIENFPVSGIMERKELVDAYVLVKKAAAIAI
jgi:aspartate ammonia-lyase